MTTAQRRLLGDLANGAVLFAALRHPEDYMNDGVVLSEAVGLRVWKGGRYVRRVRSKTADPLYLEGLIAHWPLESGDREFSITEAGRAALAST